MSEHSDHESGNSMSKRHMLMMALCCLMPMLAIVVIFVF